MDDEKKKNQFDAALPLPGTGRYSALPGGDQSSSNTSTQPDDKNPAADLIRQKVEAAYLREPDAANETAVVEELSPTTEFSKHQQFVNTLTNSGKSLVEIQTAWHDYYQNLPDEQKHEVWHEFEKMHAQTSQYAKATGRLPSEPAVIEQPTEARPKEQARYKPISKTMGELRTQVLKRRRGTIRQKPPKKFQSLLFGLAAGAGAVLIVLFGFFNERFIAPFIQPSRNVINTQLISDASNVGPSSEIIIPKINVQIPVVYDINSIEESVVQKALEDGVVHYADSALPGQNGNIAIVGHSSNNIFNSGKYKFAFVLLSRLENGDTFYLHKDGKRYTYQIYRKEVVPPDNISVLGPQDKPATATLITCDPPGTSISRLVVVGEQVSPNPVANAPQTTINALATQAKVVPGNAQSLWDRIWSWLAR